MDVADDVIMGAAAGDVMGVTTDNVNGIVDGVMPVSDDVMGVFDDVAGVPDDVIVVMGVRCSELVDGSSLTSPESTPNPECFLSMNLAKI